MHNLRRNFERFCLQHRNIGIQNLMLYVCIGNAIVYLMAEFGHKYELFYLLYFNPSQILHGQIWRLITYPLTMFVDGSGGSSLLLVAISLFCYYSIGTFIERTWGTCKFNLFYLGGIVLTDIYCLIFGCIASAQYLHMSLFLSYATMFPDATFLLYMIIPVKGWFFALIDLGFVFYGVVRSPFPANLVPIISLLNYFLFFGKDVLNLIPRSLRYKLLKQTPRSRPTGPKVIQFQTRKPEAPQQNYMHRCTVCGRTDVSDPQLEFRYCSRCNGYYCYCEDHINNHTHIQ